MAQKVKNMAMTVQQTYNRDWVSVGGNPQDEYRYKVCKLQNVIDPQIAIGKTISFADVQSWIDFGVNVSIVPMS